MGDGMYKAQFKRGQQKAVNIEPLLKKTIMSAFTICGITDDRVCYLFHMLP